jgi:type VI secretion system secreted protein Hcp
MYMKYASIDGAVATKGFEKWIELTSFSWGVGRAIGTAARGAENREGSEPSISEITVTKNFDRSSPKLLAEAWGGKMDSTVNIKFTTTSKNAVVTYLEWELTNTGISGYSVSGGGDTPTESLSLNFTKIQMKHSPLDPSISGGPQSVNYDLTQMQGG